MKLLNIVRSITVVLLGLCALQGFGQSKFYGSVKPEAAIVVKKHSMGSDLVEVTFQGADYPQSAIDDKMIRLGTALGNDPRNVTSAVGDQVVKTSFAVVGLITDKNPKVNIAALAFAFGFGEKPIRSFSVFFVDMIPDVNTPKKWFAPNDAWMMEGVSMGSPRGLDYRVQVNSSDPNEIYMPDQGTSTKIPGKPEKSGGPNIFLLGGAIGGAIGIGLLVYSALLRPRRKGL
jgi:hypothetical protein